MSLEFIKSVIAMPQSRQWRLWGVENPWVARRKSVRLPGCEKLSYRDVTVDNEGHVTRLRHAVLRPCFGAPTAYLVHGGDRLVPGRNGDYHPSRCTRCPAQEACDRTADARLRASSKIIEAHHAWADVGGRAALEFERKNGQQGRAGHRFRDLLNAFAQHGNFQSVNDEKIAKYVEDKEAQRLEDDKKRKQAARRNDRLAQLKSGFLDEELLAQIWRESIYRKVLFYNALEREATPPWIWRGDRDTAVFTALVWRIDTSMRVAGLKRNPGAIATRLINDGLVDVQNQNALRHKVLVAVGRIHRLENTAVPGYPGTIWNKVSERDLMIEPIELG